MTEDALAAAFAEAAPEHFAWQTKAPFVAEQERRLVEAAFLPLGRRVLDLGCGEGATLYHLGQPAGATGIDLFPSKIAFAERQLPACRFVCGSVYELPFEAASFDHLLARDVVHHIDEPERFIDECARVLAPGGRIDVLEPCRYNPLIAMHALTQRAERGELRSTEAFLSGQLERRFRLGATTRHQPLPIHRLVLHPELGRPQLAEGVLTRRMLETVEGLAGKLMPRFAWAYIHVRAFHREEAPCTS